MTDDMPDPATDPDLAPDPPLALDPPTALDPPVASVPDLDSLPEGLPEPIDDGAADHLAGMPMPSLTFPATQEVHVALDELGPERTVLYIYPRTGQPGQPSPTGWDSIPGARGCTPESCGFRDHHDELAAIGTEVLGLSSQSTEYQAEAARRLRLPFSLLSDPELALADALDLPTFEVDGMRLYKRLTMLIRAGVIERVWYPVFPPDQHADEVSAWLHAHPV
jgi:peroxiredoxin